MTAPGLRFVLIGALACMAGHALAQEPLDAAGIEAAMAGAATSGINAYGNPYTVHFLAGGAIEGVAGMNDEYVDSGTWWLEGDSLCRRWNAWLDGATNCFAVAIGGGQVTWTDVETGTVVVEDYAAPR